MTPRRRAPAEAITLDHVVEGQRVKLASFDPGCGFATRLTAMGLVPGVEIDMVHNCGRGPCVLGVRHARIALGRGMAGKIRVVRTA